MAIVLGLNAKIFYKLQGAASFAELSNVRNVTLNLETAEADVTTRANNGWSATEATLKNASVEWEMIYDTEDAGFGAVQEAFFGDSNNPGGKTIELKVLDGGTESTGAGLHATMRITNFSITQSLEEAVTVSVSAKPAYNATNPPQWQGGTAGGSGA